MKQCIICNKENSNYKCPRCKTPYCSLACCKTHKQDCADVPSASATTVVTSSTSKIGNEAHKSIEAVKHTYPDLLTQEHMKKLESTPWLVKMLAGSKRLRDDIKSVDSATDRQAALTRIKLAKPHFGEFVDKLLQELNLPQSGLENPNVQIIKQGGDISQDSQDRLGNDVFSFEAYGGEEEDEEGLGEDDDDNDNEDDNEGEEVRKEEGDDEEEEENEKDDDEDDEGEKE